jgi:hypothetical protein
MEEKKIRVRKFTTKKIIKGKKRTKKTKSMRLLADALLPKGIQRLRRCVE